MSGQDSIIPIDESRSCQADTDWIEVEIDFFIPPDTDRNKYAKLSAVAHYWKWNSSREAAVLYGLRELKEFECRTSEE